MEPKAAASALTPAVVRLVNNLLTQISRLDINPIEKYLEVLTMHPVAGLGFEIKVLWGLTKLGEYTHPKARIQKWMRMNFEQMNGSLTWSVSEMFMAIAIGYSFSEFAVKQVGTEFRLDTLLAVDPRYYTFEGTVGNISNVKYQQSGLPIDIPYEKGVHIVNQPYLALGRDPYGVAQCKRIVAAWEAWRILISELLLAGQRHITPIAVAKVPSQEFIILTDEYGNPQIDPETGQERRILLSDKTLEQLEGLENNSVIVTDIRNEIEFIQQSAGSGVADFFFQALRYLERIMLMGELVPETVVSTGISGTGDSELNMGHMKLMELGINGALEQIKEGLLERVCRSLIEWRYGAQDNYGAFELPADEQADKVSLLNAIRGIADGPLISNQDLVVVNRARDLAGIPPTTEVIKQVTQSEPPIAA